MAHLAIKQFFEEQTNLKSMQIGNIFHLTHVMYWDEYA